MNDGLIQLFRTRIVTVQAVQWTGENIGAVQILIAPASPLWPHGTTTMHVGLMVDKAHRTSQYDSTHELQFADVGDWIVKYPSGRVSICKAAQFEEFYEPVVPVVPVPAAAAELEVGRVLGDGGRDAAFPLGAPITTTHPRALADRVVADVADRQPETGADSHTVSER